MTKTLLVVDDVEGVRRELGYLLEDEGYRVLQAENGRVAMRVLAETPVDLVISDLLMPEVDGLELGAHIMNHYAGLNLILISGGGKVSSHYGGIDDFLAMAQQLTSAVEVLKKPFSNDELLACVERILPKS